MTEPQWLVWARKLQEISQNGLHYAGSPFDVERYEAVRKIAAEMLAAHSNLSLDETCALFDAQDGHATPKFDVRGVVFKDGKILLVRERSDGLWTLPGGWADVGEPPSRAVEREVWEESGYETRAVKLLALYDRARHGHPPHAFYIYKAFFRCELTGGGPALSGETDGVAFFPANDIPPLSVGRTTPAQIAHFFEHDRHPEWPTDFD
ncbi:MAG: NUDIX hydrolase [Anaerolineae bacterium]|nr:NUDIX hydrolase [Anaerolineae bacterium]